MMTIDTMIYIILAISGIATVSLYLNIYCAIKLYNTLDQSDKLDKANDAVDGLHLENMKLIEQKKELKQKLKQEIQFGINSYGKRSIQQYVPRLDQSAIEKLIEIQSDMNKIDKDNFKEVAYTKNVKATTSDE